MNNNINIHHYDNNYPSFSSSLLEEIYRSFDTDTDNDNDNKRDSRTYRSTHHQRDKRTQMPRDQIDRRRVDRYVLDQWMNQEKDKNVKEKDKTVKLRRNSMPEGGRFQRPLYSSSSTSSSDSSSGTGGFSSSDTDSLYGAPTRLKAIRTAATLPEFSRKSYSDDNSSTAKKKSSKKDGKLQHALKLYADFKKQQISPGGKLARIINSLFNSGNSKKMKIKQSVSVPAAMNSALVSVPAAMKSASVPSSASTFSRSCLSKTPSSAGRYDRRSVRFCPVSVVVDETGEKSVYNDVVSRMEVCGDEKQRRVEEVAKELLKNYPSNQIRKELKVNVISSNNNNFDYNSNRNIINMRSLEYEEDEESCCSSDLFELDNLLEIGVDDKYRQELPVYETTHMRTNRAIGNGSGSFL